MSKYTKFKKSKKKKIFFTVKAWKKFDLSKQMVLTNRYQIILKDYKTKQERLEEFIRFFNKTSLDNVLGNLVKIIGNFSKMNDGKRDSKIFPEHSEPTERMMRVNSSSKVNVRETVYGKTKKNYREALYGKTKKTRDIHKAVWG